MKMKCRKLAVFEMKRLKRNEENKISIGEKKKKSLESNGVKKRKMAPHGNIEENSGGSVSKASEICGISQRRGEEEAEISKKASKWRG
jgi:hypothetical protein